MISQSFLLSALASLASKREGALWVLIWPMFPVVGISSCLLGLFAVGAAREVMGVLSERRAQIEDRIPRLTGGGLTRARELAGRLRAIEDSLYQGRTQDVEDELVFPARVTERISGLEWVVESADGRPPQQTYDVFAMFAPVLQRHLEAARVALRDALPPVNAALQAKRLPAIDPKAVELRPPKPVGN